MKRYGVVSFLFLLALNGCAHYQAKPLIPGITQLPSPDKITLQQQAQQLRHPRLPPLALDFSKPLTPQELGIIAVLTNPDLKAVRAKAGVAQAQSFDAGLLPDPQLYSSLDHPYNPGPGIVNAYMLGLNWDIAALIIRPTKVKIAKAHEQQVYYDIAWQEWMVANQAELLAERVYFLQKQLALTQEALKSSIHFLSTSQVSLENHDIKIDEFGLRQTAYLDLLDQSETLQRALDKTNLQLNQTLGISPSDHLSLAIKPVEIPANLNAEALFLLAQKNRLDLVALKAGYASQEATLHQAILGQYPHFNLGANIARDNTDVRSYGGTLSFDIPIFNRNAGTIAIATANREQLYQEYLARLYQTRADIATLVSDLKQIRVEEKNLQQQLPILRKTEHLLQQGLHSGNVTLLAFNDVRANLITKELRLLTLRQDAAEQMSALQLNIGTIQCKN